MPKASKASFNVQAFREKGKGFEPQMPKPANDHAHAMRKVERIAAGMAGAVAIRQDIDPSTGDLGEPVVLRIIGRVPEAYLDSLPF